MPLVFPSVTAWAALAFQSFNYPLSFTGLWWARCSTVPHTIAVRDSGKRHLVDDLYVW